MNKLTRVVTNQVLLLGLDELYRAAMKRHESAELLDCARNVASDLAIDLEDFPVEGYYAESSKLTEYFQLVRNLQGQPKRRENELANSEAYARLLAVTSSPMFGRPTLSDSLLPANADPLSFALSETFPNWTIDNLTDAAFAIANTSDDFSLVALAALSKDPVVLTALESPSFSTRRPSFAMILGQSQSMSMYGTSTKRSKIDREDLSRRLTNYLKMFSLPHLLITQITFGKRSTPPKLRGAVCELVSTIASLQ